MMRGYDRQTVQSAESDLDAYLTEIAPYTVLSAAEERALYTRVAQGDTEAQELFVKHNLKLVVSIARRFAGNHGVPLLDLIQEGNIGLLRAVQGFDLARELKFSTYATWWIRQAVSRYLLERLGSVRLPVYVVEDDVRPIRRAEHELGERGMTLTAEHIAALTGKTVERVEEVRRWMSPLLSLDAPMAQYADFGDEALSLGDTLIAPDDFEEQREQHAFSEPIARVLASLSPRERRVIELRYGLGDEEPQTLEQVGGRLGVTRQRIYQIEMRAQRKLRGSLAVALGRRAASA